MSIFTEFSGKKINFGPDKSVKSHTVLCILRISMNINNFDSKSILNKNKSKILTNEYLKFAKNKHLKFGILFAK